MAIEQPFGMFCVLGENDNHRSHRINHCSAAMVIHVWFKLSNIIVDHTNQIEVADVTELSDVEESGSDSESVEMLDLTQWS